MAGHCSSEYRHIGTWAPIPSLDGEIYREKKDICRFYFIFFFELKNFITVSSEC